MRFRRNIEKILIANSGFLIVIMAALRRSEAAPRVPPEVVSLCPGGQASLFASHWRACRNMRGRRNMIILGMVAACIPAGAAPGDGVAVATASSSGWQAQTYAATRAVSAVAVNHPLAHSGKSSLALSVALNGAVPALRQGEAFVDLRYYPPGEIEAPVDLAGHAVRAWVYAPPGLQGPARNPNGVRLFVKDSRWHSEYGQWTHLVPGQWTQIVLTPAPDAPATGFRDAGFNPHEIILIGVSVATGGRSTARFTGQMAVDDVSWGPETAPKYGFE